MAKKWKDNSVDNLDYQRLQATLVNSGLQTENPALFQVMRQVIDGAQSFKGQLADTFKFDTKKKIRLGDDVDGLLSDKNGGNRTFYYIPEITDVANIAARVPFFCHVTVFNNLVQIYGKFTIQPTAANVLTSILFTLPIPNSYNTLNPDQLHGLINGLPLDGGTTGFPGIILNDTTTGQAQVEFYPPSTDNFNCRFSLSYIRLPL